MTRANGFWAVLASLSVAASAGEAVAQSSPTPSPTAERGGELYVSKGCYECHGRAAQGALGVGPRLAPLRLPKAAFEAYVRHPAGQMPPYSRRLLPQAELEAIFDHLGSLPAPPSAADIPILAPYVAQQAKPAARR